MRRPGMLPVLAALLLAAAPGDVHAQTQNSPAGSGPAALAPAASVPAVSVPAASVPAPVAATPLAGPGAPSSPSAPPPASGTAGDGPVVLLDRAVAIINGDVLLESDVDEEKHFAALEPFSAASGTDNDVRALERLVTRTLILQQMKEQQMSVASSRADAVKALDEARAHLPACRKYDCATQKGWEAFLKANDLTENEVIEHWQRRQAILKFIDLRFRSGIRISKEDAQDYYNKTIVPQFAKMHETPPTEAALQKRIQEILLQQKVNGLMQDWLSSLRDEGSVKILDSAYAQAASSTANITDD
jgi:peptidyl-prolyl cis-trans isomerase SurA